MIDDQGRIDRGYFELCVLSEPRVALRAGDVWLETSRRYTDPETYLIPKDRWTALRGEPHRRWRMGMGFDCLVDLVLLPVYYPR